MYRRAQSRAAGSTWTPLLAVFMIGCSLVTSYDDFAGITPRRPPPENQDVKGGSGATRAAATTSFRFGGLINEPDRPVGYDIDEFCTACGDGTPSCKNAVTTVACDNYDACIDNQVDEYIKRLGAGAAGPEGLTSSVTVMGQAVVDNLANGSHGILIELGEWDGQPDDGEVSFSIFNVTSVNDGGVFVPNSVNGYTVDDDSLLPGGAPSETVRGYVADNVVVARGFSFDLILQLAVLDPSGSSPDPLPLTIRAPFRNALFVGKLETQTESTFSMIDAQITGYIPIELVHRELRKFGLCPNADNPNDVFRQACDLRDLSLADPRNVDAPCDSMSFAIAMDVKDAKRVGQLKATPHNYPVCDVPFSCP